MSLGMQHVCSTKTTLGVTTSESQVQSVSSLEADLLEEYSVVFGLEAAFDWAVPDKTYQIQRRGKEIDIPQNDAN